MHPHTVRSIENIAIFHGTFLTVPIHHVPIHLLITGMSIQFGTDQSFRMDALLSWVFTDLDAIEVGI